jgi:hypothetical protein
MKTPNSPTPNSQKELEESGELEVGGWELTSAYS